MILTSQEQLIDLGAKVKVLSNGKLLRVEYNGYKVNYWHTTGSTRILYTLNDTMKFTPDQLISYLDDLPNGEILHNPKAKVPSFLKSSLHENQVEAKVLEWEVGLDIEYKSDRWIINRHGSKIKFDFRSNSWSVGNSGTYYCKGIRDLVEKLDKNHEKEQIITKNRQELKQLEKEGLISIQHEDREDLCFTYKDLDVEYHLYTNEWGAWSYNGLDPNEEGSYRYSSNSPRDCLAQCDRYYALYIEPQKQYQNNEIEASRQILENLLSIS